MRTSTAINVALFLIVLIASAFIPVSIFATGMSREMDSRSGSSPHQSKSSPNQFQRIEQPLALKIVVTAVGITLIGAQLWWFLGSKKQ